MPYTNLSNNIGLAPATHGRTILREQFQRLPAVNASIGVATNLDFELLGTNIATATIAFADGGGFKMTTAGADGDSCILLPHLDTSQTSWTASKWNTSDRCTFDAIIKTGSSVANAVIWAGFKLTNTNVVATDDNQVFLRMAAGGVLTAYWSNNGTDYSAATGLTLEADKEYHIEISIDVDRLPRFYVDDAKVAQAGSAQALKANVDLIPYIGVTASGEAAAKSLTVRELTCTKMRND